MQRIATLPRGHCVAAGLEVWVFWARQLRVVAELLRASPICHEQNVRVLREQLGISQEELGFRSNLDRTYVSGVERGVRNPTMMVLARLATALGVEPSALFA